MHIRTALGHKNTCRLTDDHGISSISARTLEVGVYPSLTRISYMSPWPRLMAPYLSCASGLQSAPSHILCIACQQWQAGTASSGRPGTACGSRQGLGPGDRTAGQTRPGRRRRRRRPMRQPRSGQTGQRLRIGLISIRSAGRSLRRPSTGCQRPGPAAAKSGGLDDTYRIFISATLKSRLPSRRIHRVTAVGRR
jgi:hypothetical protein